MKYTIALFLILTAYVAASLPVREDTAVTVMVGPFVDYADGKTVMTDNDSFDPDDIIIRLIKGSTGSTLTLTKTGGSNNINLTGYGMATLTMTASNVDTAGPLTISVCDAVVMGYATETILPFTEQFMVYPGNVYDSLFSDNSGISKFDESSDTVTVSSFATDSSDTLTLGKVTLAGNNDSATLKISNMHFASPAVQISSTGSYSSADAVDIYSANGNGIDVSGGYYGIRANTWFGNWHEDSFNETTLQASVEAIQTDTETTLPALISGLENISQADVRSEVDASIESYNLDHLLLTGGPLADLINDQTVMAWLMAIEGDASDYDDTTDSQEAIRDKINTLPIIPSAPRID